MDEGTHQLLERAVVDVEPQRGLDDVKAWARQRHARGRLLAGITAAIVAIVGVGGVIAILNEEAPDHHIGVSPSPFDTSQQAAALRVKIDRTRVELESLNERVLLDLHRLRVARQSGDLLGAQRIGARLQVERLEVARIEALMRHLMDQLHSLLMAPSGSPSATPAVPAEFTFAEAAVLLAERGISVKPIPSTDQKGLLNRSAFDPVLEQWTAIHGPDWKVLSVHLGLLDFQSGHFNFSNRATYFVEIHGPRTGNCFYFFDARDGQEFLGACFYPARS